MLWGEVPISLPGFPVDGMLKTNPLKVGIRVRGRVTPHSGQASQVRNFSRNMKSKISSHLRIRGVAVCTMACLVTLPLTSYAKDHKNHNNNNQWNNNNGYNGQNISGAAVAGFVLALANGYAGRGYYYGPPNTSYYNRSPQVAYYATREAAPREYYGYQNIRSHSMEASVQQALARAGYYNGPIDGSIGPMSRRAIANYQADRGLRVTGNPSNSLLNSLRLQ